MMQARQLAFREEYRKRIEPWYSGIAHVALIYAIGVGATWFFVSHIHTPISLLQWAVVPVVILVANVLEWAMHKYIMHRPRNNPIARAIYRRHTLMHHQFFTEHNYRIDAIRDFRIVFFPPYTELAAISLAVPGALLLGFAIGANAAWLTLTTVVSLYMIYELFHFCCHVPDNWLVRNLPLVNTIRRHHVAHHQQSIMMHYNMNLTFPIADWLFRTSDVKRSLLGTMFNGYSNKHVQKDLVKAPQRRRGGLVDAAG
jgi:hypothetical protein